MKRVERHLSSFDLRKKKNTILAKALAFNKGYLVPRVIEWENGSATFTYIRSESAKSKTLAIYYKNSIIKKSTFFYNKL